MAHYNIPRLSCLSQHDRHCWFGMCKFRWICEVRVPTNDKMTQQFKWGIFMCLCWLWETLHWSMTQCIPVGFMLHECNFMQHHEKCLTEIFGKLGIGLKPSPESRHLWKNGCIRHQTILCIQRQNTNKQYKWEHQQNAKIQKSMARISSGHNGALTVLHAVILFIWISEHKMWLGEIKQWSRTSE